ncbi:Arm DNA-binding domain-containing protein [Brucella sp. H1_1004]|uniref:Arm DNA-binding domain-containing protein n=1 Tax=Brucella sp. H1_1004 TaxID=3110109 RepID=UPI0039B4052F
MPKLAKEILDNADLRDKPYFIWRSDLQGFGVRVFPTNKRPFDVDYYNQVGQRKRMSIGSFGKLTVDDAHPLYSGFGSERLASRLLVRHRIGRSVGN